MGKTGTEESVADSSKRSGEETEELESEEKAKIAGGRGEAEKTPTAEGPERRSAETGPGSAVAVGGATFDTTSVEVDAAGAGGRQGAEKWERERVDGW